MGSDYLTKLGNREELERFFSTSRASFATVLSIDLDNFKNINDIYGHLAGDCVLAQVGNIFADCFGRENAFRIGGDEFLIVLGSAETRDSISKRIEAMFDSAKHMKNDGCLLNSAQMSVGVLLDVPDTATLDNVLTQSDFAMYQAKRNGKNCYAFYDDVKTIDQRQSSMTENIVRAVREDKFSISVSCVHDLLTNNQQQFVVRFAMHVDDTGTVLDNCDYRRLIERRGLIPMVDIYWFDLLCRTIAAHRAALVPGIRFCVYAGSQLLFDDDLHDLKDVLNRYDLDGSLFDFAISENYLDRRRIGKIKERMLETEELGIKHSLIDFGQNFYSLKVIEQLPISSLKFNARYYKDVMDSGDIQAMQVLKTMVDLGKSLGLYVVCGNVDTPEELAFVKSLGCQGAEGLAVASPCDINLNRETTAEIAAQLKSL